MHLHGVLYAREHGLDTSFEPYVARPLADFVLAGPEAGRLWIAERDAQIVGSIAVVQGPGKGQGQLRWFILAPEARGGGAGRRMLEAALAYSRSAGLRQLFLWTFADLKPAIHLYVQAGFRETERARHEIWGGQHTEIRMDLALA